MDSLWVEEPVHTSWSRFCTVNHWASASYYQLFNMNLQHFASQTMGGLGGAEFCSKIDYPHQKAYSLVLIKGIVSQGINDKGDEVF